MKSYLLLLSCISALQISAAAYCPEEEVRNALLASGLNIHEVESIIAANRQSQPVLKEQQNWPLPNQKKENAQQPLPDPIKDPVAFRKQMAERAKNKSFGNLGK